MNSDVASLLLTGSMETASDMSDSDDCQSDDDDEGILQKEEVLIPKGN